MKKTAITLMIILGAITFANAQSSLNDYKYVVVPHFYEFVKGKDAYRLNTITRFLLKKKGLNAFMAEEIAESDYNDNKCLALTTDVINLSNMLSTKLKVVLKNCDDEIVFESKIGTSKAKGYEQAYKEALTRAVESFKTIHYKYVPNAAILARADKDEPVIKSSESEKEVEKLKAEIKELKENKILAEQKADLVKEETKISTPAEKSKEKTKSYLKAKAIDNGFELINSHSDKVEYIIRTATIPNVFMIKNKKGIIYKKDGKWLREYVEGEQTIIEILDIRF